jgi:hypothetical protein
LYRVAVLIAVMICERPERGLLVRPEVADSLEQADLALLHEIVRIAAGEEVRARLEPDEPLVAADDLVHRPLIPVPRGRDQGQLSGLPQDAPLLELHCSTRPGHRQPPEGKGKAGSLDQSQSDLQPQL